MMRMLSASSFWVPMWAPPSPTSDTLAPVLPSLRIGIIAEVLGGGGERVAPPRGALPLALLLHAAVARVPPRNARRPNSMGVIGLSRYRRASQACVGKAT